MRGLTEHRGLCLAAAATFAALWFLISGAVPEIT